jgi:hypothetical protein
MIRTGFLLSVMVLFLPGTAGAVPTPAWLATPDNPAGPWVEVIPMPQRPSLAAVRDGGGLAVMPGRGLIYAIKGNKSGDFYAYSIGAGDWTILSLVPEGPSLKQVRVGGNIATAGTQSVYVVKGNNTVEFYRYAVDSLAWTRVRDVPYGGSGRKVKAGDMVGVPVTGGTHCYFLKAEANEFYRYSTIDTLWHQLSLPPNDLSGKWKKGSFLVFDGSHTIYAHKAKYHTMWTYNTSNDSWSSTALPGMPFVGRAGRSRKSKDGACGGFLNGFVYSLKGGNTQEFWRYDTTSRAWAEMETIPQYGSSNARRRVKGGGDMVAANNVLYALKGNKTREVWKYTPSAFDFTPGASRSTQDSGVMRDASSVMQISPNPLASGFATLSFTRPLDLLNPELLSVSISDVAGRVVRQSTICNLKSAMALDLRGLRPGVYLVRVDAGGFTATQKLAVQR